MDFKKANRFFYAPKLEGVEYTFDTFEARHLIKVLRKKSGDTVFLTDGNGKIFQARLNIISKNKAQAIVLDTIEIPPPEKKLHVLIAPTKSTDRFEWFLEKATELGVWEITPVITRLTERKKINHERMEKIIVSALKQSKRAYKPVLNEPVELKNMDIRPETFVALCEEQGNEKKFIEQKSAQIIIGPEGGFSEEEKKWFVSKKILPVKLSDYRLRTETAGIAAVCLFNAKKL